MATAFRCAEVDDESRDVATDDKSETEEYETSI